MADDEQMTLGTCCICEAPRATVLVMLNAQAPIAGHGWGCVTCGIGAHGAIAVVCEACAHAFEDGQPQGQGLLEDALRFVCRGHPGAEGRMPIDDLRGEHGHDCSKHPEIPGVPPLPVLPTDTRFPTHIEEGQGCHCSRCGCTIWDGTIAIRAFSQTEDWQYRYHGTCFGALPIYENYYDRGADLDEADFPRFDLGDDDTPCVYCGEEACEGSCTGAILAREASREDAP